MARLIAVCLRLAVLLVGVSFPLALLVSSIHASRSTCPPLSSTKVDAITSESQSNHPEDGSLCYLIDRESSRCNMLPAPSGNRWGELSVSPWCDADGNAEAVCLSFGLASDSAEQSFWGLARIRLPAGEIIDEVKLDLLPLGRPCWVPEHPGRIVFAAGDGQLYRHDFAGWNADPGETYGNAAANSNESACQVIWQKPPPLPGYVFITDPFWPGHPTLRHLVFAAVIPQIRESKQSESESTQLVWLMMSQDGAVVQESGLLHVPTNSAAENRTIRRRFPIVENGQDGTIRLAYVSSIEHVRGFRLEVIPIEIDPATGQPHVTAGCLPKVLDENCAPVPALFSADGMTVFMVSGNSGMVVKRHITSEIPRKIHMASRS